MFSLNSSLKNCKIIRKRILDLSRKVSALHIGGSFSSVEILEIIYSYFLSKKDVFILSKGHSGILQYVVLNLMGILSEKDLKNYCKKNGKLGVHPDYGNPGIEASTGSLGHGLGIATGIALSEKKTKKKIFVLISDGELHEGSVWESIIFISSNNLKNIILVVDNNNLQSSTWMTNTHQSIYPIDKKFKSFGWGSTICNGHDNKKIYESIIKRDKNKPFALILETKKGYPVSFMTNNPIWHYRSPNQKEYELALEEIENYA
jgi:transketolase